MTLPSYAHRISRLIPDAERQRVRVAGHYGLGTTISRTWCGDFLVSITAAMDNGADVICAPVDVVVADMEMRENVVPFIRRTRPGIKREPV